MCVKILPTRALLINVYLIYLLIHVVHTSYILTTIYSIYTLVLRY